MKFSRVRINGSAVVCPPVEVTSASIEERLRPVYERLGLPDGRLELMSGIRARHFWGGPILPSQAAAEAGRLLLDGHAVQPDEIGLLIFCGVCRDRMEPATAAYVHGLLGLSPRCQIMDISNACLGFVNGMAMASAMIECGQVQHALLVSGENGLPLLENTINELLERPLSRKEIKPYFANLTIGAGAAAMLLSAADDAPDGLPRITSAVVRTDSAANELCQGDAAGMGGLQMLTEAEALLDAGIALAGATWQDFQEVSNWSLQDPDAFICHQVGRSHQRRLFESLGLDRAKDHTTFETMGNVGSVSLPYTLHDAAKSGRLRSGDKVALLGIGSGLSCMMMGVEW